MQIIQAVVLVFVTICTLQGTQAATSTNVRKCALSAVFDFVQDRGQYRVAKLHLESRRTLSKGWRSVKDGRNTLDFNLKGALNLLSDPTYGKNVKGCVTLEIVKEESFYTCSIDRYSRPGRFGHQATFHDDISIYSALSNELLVGSESESCLRYLMR